MMRTAVRLVALATAPLLASCATTQKAERVIDQLDQSMAQPTENVTRFGAAVDQFGTMLRAYPRALTDPVPIDVQAIPNTSGVTDGLPSDLAPVLRTILARIGRPVEVVEIDPTELVTDLQLMEMGQLDSMTMIRRIPRLSVRGSITEGETRVRMGWGAQMDALIPLKSGSESITTHPGGSVTTVQRDKTLDPGFGTDREVEITTLAIDLHLYDYYTATLVDRLAESYRVDVARTDKSCAFGIFFEGSGLGFRSRVVGIQSKSRALRMASELALIHLLGRYFRIPWWRIVTDVATDEELVQGYRNALEDSPAAGELKLLLYAHGYDADLGVQQLTQEEENLSLRLKQELGMDPYARNDYEFITRLWETVPFERTERRMDALRRKWQEEVRLARVTPPSAPPTVVPDATPAQPAAAPATPATAPARPEAAQAVEDAPAAAASPPLPPGYPTVAKCCPFRFEPAPKPPPSDNR